MSADSGESISRPSVRRPRELLRVRRPLEQRLVLWTVALVAAPALLGTVFLNMLASRTLTRIHTTNLTMVAQTVAAALSGRTLHGWNADAQHLLQSLDLNHNLAFIEVLDSKGRIVHQQINDQTAWQDYLIWLGQARSRAAATADAVISRDGHGDMLTLRAPFWAPPRSGWAAGSGQADSGGLEGFITLGLRDAEMDETLSELRLTHFLAAAVVALASLPLAIWTVQRWVRPLRTLADAAMRLGEGQAPPPVGADTGDEIGLLAGTFNTMAQKLSNTQRQLQAANADLEGKVRARTAELERLNQRLEGEIQEKNEFLRAVGHDLGAPLRNIGGMAAILLAKYKHILAEDALNKLERISANVKAETDLINDLLELSRIRARPGKREAVDVSALLGQVRDSLAYDLERNDIRLEIADELPVVSGDRIRLRQVFLNLLDNAVKYMFDAKERRIQVDCRGEGGNWVFSVSDTGRGIAPEDLPDIFHLFRRGTHSGTHQVPGRGVGLASVKTILETYGGRIWVDSQLGRGSTFYFTLQRDGEAQSTEVGSRAGLTEA